MSGDKQKFLDALQASLPDGTFVKISLGKFRGKSGAQKTVATLIGIKGQPHLSLVTSLANNDITKNYAVADGIAHIATLLGETFLAATLFTTAKDFELTTNKKGEARLVTKKATYAAPPAATHNRAKSYLVEPARAYLQALGVSDDQGRVKPSMYAKYKQICRFIEIADDLVRESRLGDAERITVKDIGSGKGYLTFALYDHLTGALGKSAAVSGLEMRPELVKQCNDLAAKCAYAGLTFEAAAAGETHIAPVDILIALHACDTATDDALLHGIAGKAELIIVAPCCQHELAPQLGKPADALAGLVKYGLFKQRQADLVTDAARSLLLETQGYKVKIVEFVSTEHTAKNLLIAAVRSATVDRAAARRQYDALKALMGFTTQHLETRLAGSSPLPWTERGRRV